MATTRLITHNGVTQTLTTWARDLNISISTLHYRLKRWPVDEALQQDWRRPSLHPLYYTWSGMKARCNNPKSFGYPWYGARGIKVCPEWDNCFWTFVEDMGPRPHGHTVDRIDNDGDYSKDNCRWATKKDQIVNRRCA